MMEEMIDYAPHTVPSYSQDNATVYRLLQEILGSTTIHMSSITRHQRSRNGRGSYLDLVLHNMGNSKWEKTIETAEKAVTIDQWDRKNTWYQFSDSCGKGSQIFPTRKFHRLIYTTPVCNKKLLSRPICCFTTHNKVLVFQAGAFVLSFLTKFREKL